MKNKILFLLGIGVIFSSSASFAAANDALFVLLGGYTSCGSTGPTGIGMYAPFMKLKTSLSDSAPAAKIHYLVSCFGNEAPPAGNAQYILSDEPDRVLSGNVAVLMNQIEKMISEKEVGSVFIAGHSYGGWTAMYLAERLVYEGKYAALFTVDPISTKCGPMQVVLGSAVCRQAPKDLKNAVIKDRVLGWVNFFQNQDKWLRSGPIPEAENVHIQYRGPHTQVDSDDRTWARISGVVTTTLNAKKP